MYLALVSLCLLVTSRWWLPPVLPHLAGMGSVELDSVERLAGGRLRLSGLALELDGVSVEIDRVELPFEWVYLHERFLGEWSAASTLRVGQVQVRSEARKRTDRSEAVETFLPQVVRQLSAGIDVADPWLPAIVVEAVTYQEADKRVARVAPVEYHARRLVVGAEVASLPGAWRVVAELSPQAPWQLDFSQSAWGLSGRFQMGENGEQVSLDGVLERGDSRLELAASFGGSAWLPTSARVSTDGFDLSGFAPALMEKLSLTSLRLNQCLAEWDGGSYRFQASGASVVQAEDPLEQKVAFELSGDGDLQTLRLQQASFESDWVQLQLSEPLAVDFAQRNFIGQARLQVEANLARQPWIEAEGSVEAAVRLDAEDSDVLRFDLSGRDLAYAGVKVRRLNAKGELGFETLSIDSLALALPEAEKDEQIEISGTVTFENKTLDLVGSAFLGADWLNALLGQSIFVDSLELSDLRVTGPWSAPALEATMRTAIRTEATEAIALYGDLRWDGRQRLDWKGSAGCDGAEIEIKAGVLLGKDAYSIQLDSLRWSDPDRPELVLKSPVQARWLRAGDAFERRLSLSRFVLEGDGMQIMASYSPQEGLALLLRNVSLARLNRWVSEDLPNYHVESIQCKLNEFRPTLMGRVAIAVEERIEAGTNARVALAADLGKNAIRVKDVSVVFSGEEVLAGDLDLPLRLRLPLTQKGGDGSKKSFYEIGDGGLRGRLKGELSPGFSAWLQGLSGLRLGEGRLDLQLSGDLSQPVGHVDLRIASVALDRDPGEKPWPALRDLTLQIKVDAESVAVKQLDFTLNESGLQATTSIPMKSLVDAVHASEFNLEQLLRSATGEIRLKDWQGENWIDWLPPLLRRSGSLTGALKIEPAMQFSGELRFQDLGLRPTAKLASVDRISGRVRLEERLLRLEEAGAMVGGSPISLTGEVNLTDWRQPRWFAELKGQNVSLLRTTEMILRSDLDISVDARDRGQPPVVAGTLGLRSSTLLVEFDPLAPRLKKGTAVRPPFFRITQEPVADWQFDLKISGDRFMRVRSPYFRTRLSVNMALTGTFGDPLLLGAVRTNDAELSFPGAKFVINKGEALIEPSRPNEVQLAFNGIAQRASKVIVMDVSQTLEDPLIHFESTPPMSQADIVRLLATGSTTGGGVGNLGIYLGQGLLGAGGMNESFADKLSVDVGEETSRSGRKTVGARYELSPRWSLEGGYDVFDAYNADLIWTIFKK